MATVAEAAADVVVAQTEDDDEAGTADESRAEAADDDDEAGTADDDDEVERDDEAERGDAAVVFCEETRESLPFSIFTQSPVSHMAFWCWPK